MWILVDAIDSRSISGMAVCGPPAFLLDLFQAARGAGIFQEIRPGVIGFITLRRISATLHPTMIDI
jgi:hypothetical protein